MAQASHGLVFGLVTSLCHKRRPFQLRVYFAQQVVPERNVAQTRATPVCE